MKERSVDLQRAVVAHHQAAVVPQPADSALDDPAMPIPPQCATVLRRRANAILLVRADQFNPTPPQTLPQRIAIVGFVGDHPHRLLPGSARPMPSAYADRRERRLREGDFRRGCRVKVVSQRKTRAVDHHIHFVPLPPGTSLKAAAPLAMLPWPSGACSYSNTAAACGVGNTPCFVITPNASLATVVSYGDLTANQNIVLTAGTYNFNTFQMNGGSVTLRSVPVVINLGGTGVGSGNTLF